MRLSLSAMHLEEKTAGMMTRASRKRTRKMAGMPEITVDKRLH
jgi:hypothetical protein